MGLDIFAKIRMAQTVAPNSNNQKLAELREQHMVSRVMEAQNKLKRMIEGKVQLPTVEVSTQILIDALQEEQNCDLVINFIRLHPNRVFYEKIPELIEKTKKGKEIFEIYLSRLLNPGDEFKPCWVRPEWLEEGDNDGREFWFAVLSLLASLTGNDVKPNDVRFIVRAIQDSYTDRLVQNHALFSILEKVMDNGKYYLPRNKIPPEKYASRPKKEESGKEEYEVVEVHETPPPNCALATAGLMDKVVVKADPPTHEVAPPVQPETPPVQEQIPAQERVKEITNQKLEEIIQNIPPDCYDELMVRMGAGSDREKKLLEAWYALIRRREREVSIDSKFFKVVEEIGGRFAHHISLLQQEKDEEILNSLLAEEVRGE